MRAKEFLVEYNRQKTANALGNKLVLAFMRDGTFQDDLTDELTRDRQKLLGMPIVDNGTVIGMDPEFQQTVINDVLAAIESRDPTANKEYTQWLARKYAQGNLKLEDINRGNLLDIYHLGKRRRMIQPEHADINRFEKYKDFEDVMLSKYNLDDIDGAGQVINKGKSTVVLNNEQVRIIVPENKEAAIYYGQGTKWCTAMTRGYNHFDSYNGMGKLYILLPKQPQYDGEKYQIHFKTGQCMDPQDDPVNMYDLLKNRFGDLIPLFKKIEPEANKLIMFADDSEISRLTQEVSNFAFEYLMEVLSEWEANDDFYYQEMLNQYGNDDGEVNWEKAHADGNEYTDWNDEAARFVKKMEKLINPSPDALKQASADMARDGNDHDHSIASIPDIMSHMIQEAFPPRNHSEHDGGLADFLRRKIDIRPDKDGKLAAIKIYKQ